MNFNAISISKLKIPFIEKGALIKILLAMKLTVIFMLAAVLQISAKAYTQQFTFSEKNATLEKVFKQIKAQSDYVFFYEQNVVDKAIPVNINVKKASLKSVLDLCFENQPLTYNVVGKTIVVKQKNEKTVERSGIIRPEVAVITLISGKVTDEDGNPIGGVSLIIKETKWGTVTNPRGDFAIDVKPGLTLLVSAIGYESQEIKITSATTKLNIVLKMTVKAEDEITINSGIFKKETKSYTGAATTFTISDLEKFGTKNLITSLRNIDPSFNIVESNVYGSDPNRMPEIQIRGNSSIPNVNNLQDEARVNLNTPLIILDGFESTLRKLLDINENEVESITLLKDAAATSIYGSRGANGVVVIKTKLPKAKQLRISYRGDAIVEVPDVSDYNLLNAREKLDLEYLAGYYTNERPERDVPLKRYYNYLINEINSGVETDWISMPLRNSVGQRHNISLTGGSEAFRYSASAQMNYVPGVMKGSFRKTFNGALTLSYYYRTVRFTNQINITQNNAANSPYGAFSEYAVLNPYWRAFDDNGKPLVTLGNDGTNDSWYLWGGMLPTSPLYNAKLNTFDKNNLTEIANRSIIEWNVTQNLTLRGQLGVTKNISQSDRFRPAKHTAFFNYTGTDVFRKGDYAYGIGNGLAYDGSLNLSYNKLFNRKHLVFGGIDYNIRQNSSVNYNILAEGFNNPNFDFLPMALQYAQNGKPTGSESLVRSVGAVANVSYTYDNRYVAELSYRVDGASQYGKTSRFAPFWSVGAAWNIHEEAFFKNITFINRLKLRASMGPTGAQGFDAYQALSTYRYYLDNRYNIWNGAYLIGLGNENLKWQQTFKTNVGFDAEILDRLIRISGNYYDQVTNGLVSSVNIQPSSGFSSYVDNIGKIKNSGFEVNASVFIFNNPQGLFTWSVTGGVVQNKNKVIEVSKALKDIQAAMRENGNNPSALIYTEGYSSNTIWAVRSLGIDPSSGQEVYLDLNGNPTYTWSGKDVMPVGNTDPKYFGNFSTFLRYKTLSFNVAFTYRYGGQQYNNTLLEKVETNDYHYNVDKRVYYDKWKAVGDISAFKGILNNMPTYKTSRFVQNENTVECRNISLQYDVRNTSILKATRLQMLSFAANMADPFRISSIKRERGTSYPFSRSFSININATF